MSPNPLSNNWTVYLVGGVIGLFIFGYALFVALPYLLGPSLTVETPVQNSSSSSPTILISGTTARVSFLSVNDMPLPLAEDGSFKVVRALPSGYTVIVVRARDRFERETTRTIPFVHSFVITNATTGTTTNHGTESKKAD